MWRAFPALFGIVVASDLDSAGVVESYRGVVERTCNLVFVRTGPRVGTVDYDQTWREPITYCKNMSDPELNCLLSRLIYLTLGPQSLRYPNLFEPLPPEVSLDLWAVYFIFNVANF